MIDVACIGILVADIISKPVDSIPKAGLLNQVDYIGVHNGGCAMTAGINMSVLGLKTAVLGKVGDDQFGYSLKNELIKYNINIDGLRIDDSTQTSASIVMLGTGGERTFLHCQGANGTFCYDDVNFDVISNSKIVFIAGTMLMDQFDGNDCSKVLKRCKEMGKITVLDTAWDTKGRWMKVLEPCMPYIDLFLPSIDEAIELSGKSELKDITDIFFELSVKQVAIKLGSKGCYLRECKGAEGIIIPPYKVDTVDCTGAGDSFCSGFITGMVKGLTFAECGKLANATGAHCVMNMGATTGMKRYEDILEFMKIC